MSDAPGAESLTLRYLHATDGKPDRLPDEVCDLKQRMTTLEIAVGNASAASHYGQVMPCLETGGCPA